MVLSFFLQGPMVYAQMEPANDIHKIINRVTTIADSSAREKIYLQTDKPFYATNDTMWFKIYLFNAAYLTPSSKSGIAYIEIANEENKVDKRMMVSLFFGLGWGNITLKEKDFPQGNYTLRAYTNWMRNSDEHYVFKKQFYISSPDETDLLIKSSFDVEQEASKPKADIGLQINKIDQQPLPNTDFQLRITEDKKVWYRDKIKTSYNGSLNFNFNIPEKANPDHLSVTLQAMNKKVENPVYKIPVIFNRPEDIDLQFMSEGGYLVTGMDTRIAFKALSEDGNGTTVSGSVYNSKQEEVLTFQSTHLGMGSFSFHPQPGETYTARIKMPDGTYSKDYALPPVKSSGIVLDVINKLESDSLEIGITATPDVQSPNSLYYLIGQSRGIACYGAVVRLNQQMSKMKVSKTFFPTGITRFTLLNADKQPLNERIVYIDHDDHLRIHITSDKAHYTKRDSVGLTIEVTDKNGQPVEGDFSVAVTDDAQIKNDSVKRISLKSELLLSSDLKGRIEDPGYYFPSVMTTDIWQRLDNLLLAQGWVNYDWAFISQPLKPLLFPAESVFSVKGKVTNIFNKPVKRSGVVLLSKKPSFVRDTITNEAGVFDFKNIYPSDTAVYVIQARNKKGKSFNVGIEVDEFQPPVFSAPKERIIPWYVNIDSNKIKAVHTLATYKEDWEKIYGGKVLAEVKVAAKKIIKDSKNLNEDGGSDLALNEEDLQNAGKVTLGDLLTKNVKGFHLGYGKLPYAYFIEDRLFHLIIDGVDIDWAKPVPFGTPDYQRYVKQFLDYYTAEDIKGIEVMKSSRYAGRYVQTFLGPYDNVFDNAFVEVTTYSGSGPYLKKTPGVYLYKPLPFCPQMQFYSPKYHSKYDSSFVDIRSTIYWEPNIITDKNGKAVFSFYTADHPGTYTLLIEGSDMNGNIESASQKIIVK